MAAMRARALSLVLMAYTLELPPLSSALAREQTDRTHYYTISGASAGELREAMNRRRPVGQDGKPHDAITSWYVRWRYATTVSSAGCAVKSFNVFLDVSMTLPHWTNDSDASPALVEHWRRYYAALLVHEAGHKAIASGAADDIREAGSRLPTQPSCGEVTKAIEKATNEILERYRQREREYDLETGHGRTQGARFP